MLNREFYYKIERIKFINKWTLQLKLKISQLIYCKNSININKSKDNHLDNRMSSLDFNLLQKIVIQCTLAIQDSEKLKLLDYKVKLMRKTWKKDFKI